jgi:magnesium transporter
MLTAYTLSGQTITRKQIQQYEEMPSDALWLDLKAPTDQERKWVKDAYNQELQFMEELGEIEASSRYYRDEAGMHLNLYFLALENGFARNVNVAFTINNDRLFTLRTDETLEIRAFFTQASKSPAEYGTPAKLMTGIVATRIGMMADVYEKLQTDLEPISNTIFRADSRAMPRALEALARIEDINGKARLGFMENKRAYANIARNIDLSVNQEAINEIMRDVESLMNYSDFLAERTKFLMDASVGMINIAHNRRLGVFTILSVILMPPMLIASIYGMNFKHMPELSWEWGYPLAIVLMLAVAIGPILYLRHRDWL